MQNQSQNLAKLLPPLDIDVDEGSDFIVCTNELDNGRECGAEIPLSRKPKDNPVACPNCGRPLRIFAPDGHTPLNLHGQLISADLPLALVIADKFKQTAFPSAAIAQQWRAFEMKIAAPTNKTLSYDRVLIAADECLRLRGESFGSACWGWIMARCANKAARDTATTVTPVGGRQKRYVSE